MVHQPSCCLESRTMFPNLFLASAPFSDNHPPTSGVQRSGDARGDCLIVCPPNKCWC